MLKYHVHYFYNEDIQKFLEQKQTKTKIRLMFLTKLQENELRSNSNHIEKK